MISIIVAMDRNRVIGKDNKLPWRIPAELAYFKRVTMGHPIVMGRKTHQSIGKPLAGRHNIVLTRDPGYLTEGCTVVHSAAEACVLIRGEEGFVIGGAEIIALFWPLADKLYVTWIDHEFEGDTFFPEIDPAKWEITSETPGTTNEKNPYTYFFRIYEKRDSS